MFPRVISVNSTGHTEAWRTDLMQTYWLPVFAAAWNRCLQSHTIYKIGIAKRNIPWVEHLFDSYSAEQFKINKYISFEEH